jgi:mannose-6-phosphate isomerase-like protein (cupin superfamily)
MILFESFWSDIGSYNALLNYSHEYINYKSLNNYVNTKKQTILSNVSNLTVVETEDCILVSDINKSQEIKQTFDLIKKYKPELQTNKNIDYRPWGYYEVLQDTPTFKLKKITVNPNKKLSLQSHNFRSEHWICLSGTGKAQINDELIQLIPDKSVFIKVTDKHRLINDSNDDLVIVELQTGTYFGEDDIIRYEDDYGR